MSECSLTCLIILRYRKSLCSIELALQRAMRRKTEDGRWKMEDGRWKTAEDGRRKMEDGRWRSDCCRTSCSCPAMFDYVNRNRCLHNLIFASLEFDDQQEGYLHELKILRSLILIFDLIKHGFNGLRGKRGGEGARERGSEGD
jgi:hypothetical protein